MASDSYNEQNLEFHRREFARRREFAENLRDKAPLRMRVRQARGRHWFCSHCDATNLPSFKVCYGCDRPRFEK